MRKDSKWAGTASTARVSGVLMAGLLPRPGRKVPGNDLAEHQQDFLALWRGQARPQSNQRLGRRRGLRARGGTRRRWVSDMMALRSVQRDVPGTTAPVATARPR